MLTEYTARVLILYNIRPTALRTEYCEPVDTCFGPPVSTYIVRTHAFAVHACGKPRLDCTVQHIGPAGHSIEVFLLLLAGFKTAEQFAHKQHTKAHDQGTADGPSEVRANSVLSRTLRNKKSVYALHDGTGSRGGGESLR